MFIIIGIIVSLFLFTVLSCFQCPYKHYSYINKWSILNKNEENKYYHIDYCQKHIFHFGKHEEH